MSAVAGVLPAGLEPWSSRSGEPNASATAARVLGHHASNVDRRTAISLDNVASLSGRRVAVARATARQRAEDARAASGAISDEKNLVTHHAAQPAGL